MNVSRRWLEAFLRQKLDVSTWRSVWRCWESRATPLSRCTPDSSRWSSAWSNRCVPHPNADRLRLCQVFDGSPTRLSVVCGAPNVAEGKKYPFARIGVTLPGGITLERRKIRGEPSEGMLCSARELGLGQEHDGILEIATDAAPGTPLLDVLELADDRLILDVTPIVPIYSAIKVWRGSWRTATACRSGCRKSPVLPPRDWGPCVGWRRRAPQSGE